MATHQVSMEKDLKDIYKKHPVTLQRFAALIFNLNQITRVNGDEESFDNILSSIIGLAYHLGCDMEAIQTILDEMIASTKKMHPENDDVKVEA